MLEVDAIFGDVSLVFLNSGKREVSTGDGVRFPLFVPTLVKGGMLSPSSKLGDWTMSGVARGTFINVVNESIPQ